MECVSNEGAGVLGQVSDCFGMIHQRHLDVADNVVFPSNFFQCIYHVGCAFNLHSITNSGLVLGGQSSSKRQTVFFRLVNPMDKEHKRS